jgi:hypothetical protein
MELMSLGEKCKFCPCSTCQKTYQTEDTYDPCYRWCIESCKGKYDVVNVAICYKPVD